MFNFPLTDLDHLKELRHGLWEDPGFNATFFTSDVGALELGEDIDPFVSHADIYVSCTSPRPFFVIAAQGNEISVNLVQRHFDKSFALKLLGVFRDMGVLAKYQDCGRFECDKFHVRNIEKES